MAEVLSLPLESVSGPKQARSERTLQRLLDAAEALIKEKGHAAVSIPEIARRAGSSVGGFYARFRDKNELLRALEERHFIELLQRRRSARRRAALGRTRRRSRDRRGGRRRAGDDHARAPAHDRRVSGPRHRGSGHPRRRPALPPPRRGAHRAPCCSPRRDEMTHPDPALAIDLGIQTAFALMQQHVLIEETAGRRPPLSRRRAAARARDHVSPLRRHRPSAHRRTRLARRATSAGGRPCSTRSTTRFRCPPAAPTSRSRPPSTRSSTGSTRCEKQNLLNLYEKGKTLAWNANDLDWSIDVNLERMVQRARRQRHGADDERAAQPAGAARRRRGRSSMQLNMNAFMLSQFLHGEQGALLATAKIVQGVPWEEAKFYAANQVADEARHVEVYHRYLTEKLGLSYEMHAEPQPAARRHHPRPALGHHLPRHADHGRGAGAGRVRRHPHADGGRAADPGPHRPRHGRRVAPRRLRRARRSPISTRRR